jgi:glycopeptide antibiotics resistance protein
LIHSTAGHIVYTAIGIVIFLFISYCLREFARKQATGHDWLAWVPVARFYLLSEICGHGLLWAFLMLVPVVNIVIFVIVAMKLARMRGHRRAFGLLLFIPLVQYFIMWNLAGLQQSRTRHA